MRIVRYIVSDDSVQFRYRVQNINEVLSENKSWHLDFRAYEAHKSLSGGIDLIVIQRQTDKTGIIGDLIKKAHLSDVDVLMDLDDLVFDYRDLRVLKESVREKTYLYWLGYVWGIRRVAKKVDGFICTNEFLAGKLRRSFGKPVKVIRNSLNKEQVEISEKLAKKKDVRKIANSSFSIGYFSGSPTHTKDFAMVEPELIRFLESHDDAKLKIVGYMDLSKKMQQLKELGKVELTKLVDYLRLQGLMSKVDVNIAPLVINDFTNCKSELKFFEAAVVETTTIASPNYSFKKAISDGENGFLAKPGEWFDKLEYLYNHPEENRRIALAAKKYALKHYYGKEFLKEVEEAYDYFAK